MDVIKASDYIIDIGPDGGRRGGEIVTTGTPLEVSQSGKGSTALYLKKELDL
jgi:excinuclease ABC subunit A